MNIYTLYVQTTDSEIKENIYSLPPALLRALKIGKCSNVQYVDVCNEECNVVFRARGDKYEILSEYISDVQVAQIISEQAHKNNA